MSFFSPAQITAVRIAKPKEEEDTSKQPTSRKDSVQRQCRNIVIHGSCRYQDKGCSFYHPPTEDSVSVPPPPASPKVYTESPSRPTITSQAVNAPVFVPKFAVVPSPPADHEVTSPPVVEGSQDSQNTTIDDAHQYTATMAGYQDQGNDEYHESQLYEQEHQDYGQQDYTGYGYDYQVDQAGNGLQGMDLADQSYYEDYHSHDIMETSYYNAAPVFLRQPLNYLLYTPLTPAEQTRNPQPSHFISFSADLRQALQERGETARTVNAIDLGLPEEMQGYHTLVPLEPINGERKKFGNWHSTVYRATRTSDGVVHCLRRVENFRLMHPAAFAPIEAWSQIQHPSIVPVREAFTTRSFNDNSLVVSYAYYPNAQTLYDAHMKPKPQPIPTYQSSVYYGRHHPQRNQIISRPQQLWIEERTLWSYIVQIASAIKKVHERGLAVRMIDVSKIIVTGKNRVRISSCGIFDVLLFDSLQPDLATLQQEDLLKFGRLIFALCSGNLAAASPGNLQKSVEAMKKVYSIEVQALALYLCSSKIKKTIDEVLDMIRPKILQEHDEALMATDRLENELMGELENARLFRLMCKFGFINERPEFARDARWSETGDRYIIKLFRDYVFHQVDEHGNPVLDLSHVLTCLNKLDAGTDEKLMLVARDEQSCLVVSYKDIKACVANAFDDLVRATTAMQSGKA